MSAHVITRKAPAYTVSEADITALIAKRDHALANVYNYLRPVLAGVTAAFRLETVELDEVYEDQGTVVFFFTVVYPGHSPSQWCVTIPVELVDARSPGQICTHVRRHAIPVPPNL